MNIVAKVTAAAAIDRDCRWYTTKKLENPKNSQVALIVAILVESLDLDYNNGIREYQYLLYKPETETWHNICLRLGCLGSILSLEWQVNDQLTIATGLNLTHKLQAFLAVHDVTIEAFET